MSVVGDLGAESGWGRMLTGMVDDAEARHMLTASAAHAHCFAELPLAEAYNLSKNEQIREGMNRNSANSDLTYGDVPFDVIAAALEKICPEAGSTFIDLGSGVGRGVVAAALLWPFAQCIGVEILSDLHRAALGPVQRFRELKSTFVDHGLDPARLATGIEVRCSDLFTVDLAQCCRGDGDGDAASAGVMIFVCCVTWPVALMARLASKLAQELPDGASVCTVGQRLPHAVDLESIGGKGAVQFEETSRFEAPFEWGAEVVVCARAVRLGTLAARRLKKQGLLQSN